jgi:uncharacterized protein (DUF427 family)
MSMKQTSKTSRTDEPDMPRESVWEYPRPPRLEKTSVPLKVYLGEEIIASTNSGFRLLETSHPPTYYFAPQDVRMDRLSPVAGGSFCEFKGNAQYFDVVGPGRRVARGALTYPRPVAEYAALSNCIAFYPSKMTTCWVGSEIAKAQDGDFYGAWITANLIGPFKGAPGTLRW